MPRKGKSGRTKGAVSFLAVKWGDLNRMLKPDAQVIVSRRYCEQLGLDGVPVSATSKNIEAHAKQIDVKVNTLEEEEDEGVANVKISDLSDEW
jgi:hypothetical protein